MALTVANKKTKQKVNKGRNQMFALSSKKCPWNLHCLSRFISHFYSCAYSLNVFFWLLSSPWRRWWRWGWALEKERNAKKDVGRMGKRIEGWLASAFKERSDPGDQRIGSAPHVFFSVDSLPQTGRDLGFIYSIWSGQNIPFDLFFFPLSRHLRNCRSLGMGAFWALFWFSFISFLAVQLRTFGWCSYFSLHPLPLLSLFSHSGLSKWNCMLLFLSLCLSVLPKKKARMKSGHWEGAWTQFLVLFVLTVLFLHIYISIVVVVVVCFQAFLFIFRSMVRACFSRRTGRITRRKSQRSGWPDVAAPDRC